MTGSLMQLDDVTVSITSLARPRELARTLDTVGDAVSVQVILNGANVEDYDAVIARFTPRIRFITNDANIGVAASWNQGLVESSTRYVVLSGDDLAYSPGWAEALVRRFPEESQDRYQVTLSSDPAFSSFCVDKQLIAHQGWFDENFTRVYYEDEDWWLRTAERLGLQGAPLGRFEVIPDLRLVHRDPARRAAWNSIPNRLYFWRKWRREAQATQDSLYLRPDVPVARRRSEPAWPLLEAARAAYAAADFSRRAYTHSGALRWVRLITWATTNRPVIWTRRLYQQVANSNQELR